MKKFFVLLLSALTVAGFLAPAAAFAHPGRYQALLLNPPGAVTLAPGGSTNLQLRFQNVGDHFWNSKGRNYVSLYTWGPKYRASVFRDARWYSRAQTGVVQGGPIPAGATGVIELPLKAPATPGTYTETFALAAEDLLWIPGGQVTVTIAVAAAGAATSQAPQPAAAPAAVARAPSNSPYQAQIIESPQTGYTLPGNGEAWVKVVYRNTGAGMWTEQKVRPKPQGDVTIAGVAEASYRHPSWDAEDQVMHVLRAVSPGDSSVIQFPFRAPPIKGSYQVTFQLVTNGESVAGSDFDIPVTVTSDAPTLDGTSGAPIATPTPAPVGVVSEPKVRIGLYTADGSVMAMSDQPARVELPDGTLIGSVSAGVAITLAYDPNANLYTVQLPGVAVLTTGQPVRLVPTSPGLITITNYSNPPSWNRSLNDNVFRGALEIRRAPTGYTWVINELPMEQYLAGLAETSNRSHSEYHKAIIVAARTYAYYHLLNNDKHAKGGFTLDAYWDQVYRGYNSELRMPRFGASVAETRGEIVTYQNEVVVTPYFARSDGRTRAWNEVWGGGAKPWLPSVPVPSDAGSRLLGHGVGMSATGAGQMAIDGQTYRQILPYFYVGTEIKKLW